MIAARWWRFNAVGLGGVVVQLITLSFLVNGLGWNYRVATGFAVELALLHNFLWHEAWTWRGAPLQGRWGRLLRFHAANGLFSIAANVLLTWAIKEYWSFPLLLANVTAISIAAILNFAIAEFWVFKRRDA